MINSSLKNNGLGNCWSCLPVYHKQLPIATKKIALRDVQNDSRSLTHNDPESCVLVELIANDVNVSGNKRITPECPLKPHYLQSWRSNGANEHLIHADWNFDSELGKRKVREMPVKKTDFLKLRKYFHNQPELPQQDPDEQEKNTSSVPASASTVSPGRPSVPIFLEEPGNRLPAADSNHLQFTSEYEVPHSADSKGHSDYERKEQFLYLQKPLKHRDEYDQRDKIHILRHLSSVELSRCAVELEKRSIQLSIEEVQEVRRMNALNILGKSSLTNNPSPTFQQVQTKR